MRLCLNRSRKLYGNGRYYPRLLREQVLDMIHSGISQRTTATELKTSRYFVQNVLADYDRTGCSLPHMKVQPERRVITPDVVASIEIEKLMKPSIYSAELQDRLLLDGITHPWNLPSRSTISKCVRNDLFMTKKRIQQIPAESQRNDNIELRNDFLEQMADLDLRTVHCFDESSVLKTTANRRYRSAPKGQPAFEIQRYASNCTYTINLLHSPFGVDFVDVIEGPSNGNLLLLFFEEAVNLTRADGTAVLERGDTVILDNCGFHHGHFVEPILREMLGECGVNLLFQPPYSPEFNSCEFCFHDIKEFLRRNQRLAVEHTEYAIYEACANITQAKSVAYFLHCGYLL